MTNTRTISSVIAFAIIGLTGCSDQQIVAPSPIGGGANLAVAAGGSMQLDYMADPGGNTFRVRNTNAFGVSVAYRVQNSAFSTTILVPGNSEYFVATTGPGMAELLLNGVVVDSASNGGAPLAAAPTCHELPATIWPGAAGSVRTVVGSFDAPTRETWTFFGTQENDVIVGSDFPDRLNSYRGDDVLCGRGASDVLAAGRGTNLLDGEGGNDYLNEDRAAELVPALNTLIGGPGDDWVYVTSQNEKVIVDLVVGTIVGGFHNGSTLDGIERISVRSNVPSELYGDSADNVLSGRDRADIIDGRGGNDKIFGQDGADMITGGEGNDIVFAGGGDDTVDAGDGSDELYGGPGTNTLIGGNGNDRFGGDARVGLHHIDGGAGIDVVYTTSGGDLVTADLVAGTIVGGMYDGSTMIGIENLTNATGSAPVAYYGDFLDNRLTGGNAADLLDGREGQDYIVGGAGNDTMNGGKQGDTFTGGPGADQFNGDHGARNTARDFSPGQGDTTDGRIQIYL